MKRKTLFKLLKKSIPALIGFIIAFAVAVYRGFSLALPATQNYRYVSDGLFVAGFLLAGIGGLTTIATSGFFDMFSYAMMNFVQRFTKIGSRWEHVDFYDYKVQKQEKRGKPQLLLLFTGLLLCLLSVVFLRLYYGGGGV